MKSREVKRREAWQLTAGVGGVVAGLLLLYGLSEGVPPTRIGIMVPLITVAGALWGVYLGAHLAQQQRLEDERRRRHALATILLSEVQLLYLILKDIHQAFYLKALHTHAIEPFHTTMYDQAGTDRLLFQSETAHVLAQFYQVVHTLRTELNRFRDYPPEQRTHLEYVLLARTKYTAELVEKVMYQLSAEGGTWPMAFPARTYTEFPEEPDAPPFPSFPKPPRRLSSTATACAPRPSGPWRPRPLRRARWSEPMTLIAVYTSEGCIGRCNAKCYNATEPHCNCICGGLNHGGGLAVAIENIRRHAEVMIEKYAGAKGLQAFRAELGYAVEQLRLF